MLPSSAVAPPTDTVGRPASSSSIVAWPSVVWTTVSGALSARVNNSLGSMSGSPSTGTSTAEDNCPAAKLMVPLLAT